MPPGDGVAALRAAGIDVSRETLERLETFVALLRRWNSAINLVGPATLEQVWQRHIADSAQLFPLRLPGTRHWADLGSGAGFPGLVIAALAAEHAPEMRITLVESDHRKAAFLTSAVAAMALSSEIVAARAETHPPLRADTLSARALAPLVRLLPFAERHLAPGGRALFPKGQSHADELAAALETWRASVQKIPSRTDADGVILCLEGIARA